MKTQREPVELGIKIQVDVIAMQKLWCCTEMARGEVSALGLVEEIRAEVNGKIIALRVTDFFLVKQTCNLAETELDASAVA